MTIRRLMILPALPAAVVAGASPQTAPAGWQEKATQQAWIATSPALGNGDRVQLVFYPVMKASGELDAWFDGQVAQRPKGMGMIIYQDTTIGRQEAPSVSPLLRRVATLSKSGHVRSMIVINLGYETSAGRQFVQIVMPALPGKPSAAYLTAVGQVTTGWLAGVVYRQSPEAPSTPAKRDP